MAVTAQKVKFKSQYDADLVRQRLCQLIEGEPVNELEKSTGIDPAVFYALRKGKAKTTNIENIYTLCQLYDTSIIWVLGITDKTPHYKQTDRLYSEELMLHRFKRKCDQFFRSDMEAYTILGVTKASFDKLLTGDYEMTCRTLYRMCEYTRTSPDWITGLIDKVRPKLHEIE